MSTITKKRKPCARAGLWVLLLPCLLLSLSCSQQSEDDEWLDFGRSLIGACRDGDKALLMELSWTDLTEMAEIGQEVGVNSEVTQEQVDMHLLKMGENIEIFLRSYEDLCTGEPVRNASASHPLVQEAPHLNKINPKKFILWVKQDGKYHGIKIETVVRTRKGLRVMDWVGSHGPPSAGRLWRKQANLVRDDLASCNYPSDILYQYEYRTNR